MRRKSRKNEVIANVEKLRKEIPLDRVLVKKKITTEMWNALNIVKCVSLDRCEDIFILSPAILRDVLVDVNK